MTITNKIALLSFGALLIFVGIDPVQAQWTGSPVLISGESGLVKGFGSHVRGDQ